MSHPRQLIERIQKTLSPDLLKAPYRARNQTNPLFGHCYAASEALWHLLGGPDSGHTPCRGRDKEGICHWWLSNNTDGSILDPTAGQYTSLGKKPPYAAGVNGGFLTKEPSARALLIIQRLGVSRKAVPKKRSQPKSG